MLRFCVIAVVDLACVTSFGQSPKFAKSPSEAESLLAKTNALYDTPFRGGLINFSCKVNFDFAQNVKANYGEAALEGSSIANLIEPIRYQAFVDHSGASISAQPKLLDLSQSPLAAQVEESNRSLIQAGLNSWVPYAYGEVLPIGSTRYEFERTASGYNLSTNGQGINGNLVLDDNLHLISGIFDGSMHLEITTKFVSGPNGLLLAESSTNSNHEGVGRFTYTYQAVDGFQIPQQIRVTSEKNKLTLSYTLTDCVAHHGTVLQLALPKEP